MRRGLMMAVIAGVAALVAACTPQVTVENPPSTPGQATGISVSGTGTVVGAPDTLTMSFGVRVVADTVSEAVATASSRADAVIAALVDNGVAEDDIQTTNYSIYPRYDYRNNTEILIGYEVSNDVTAKIRDIASSGATIDAVTAAGGDDVVVSGVSFSIEDDAALIDAAREAAWNDAKAKAEQLAALGGVGLGAPTTISETFTTPPPPIAYASDVAGAAESATPIAPGQQDVVVTITVQFDIVD
jgi:uncharacterized protein YggE